MSNVVHLTDAEVINFDEARARHTLRRVDEAMGAWLRTGVELADLAHQARRDECWRVDDDFKAALAAGTMVPADGRGVARAWLGWKLNQGGRYAEFLADYGALREIIAADPALPELAEPERAARPLGKLLRPLYKSTEQVDTDERDEAIRQVWRSALEFADGNPSKAIKEVPKALQRCDYAPLRRLAKKQNAQKDAERQQKIDRAVKAMLTAGHLLIQLGAIDRFDDAIKELAEARKR
jgi:tetratricopeptide (TPR) repeat protein